MILLDLLESRVQSDRLILGIAKVMGADTEIPDLATRREEWDDWLRSEPPVIDPDRQILIEALFPKR